MQNRMIDPVRLLAGFFLAGAPARAAVATSVARPSAARRDTIVACAPSRPAIAPGDTVTLRVFADPPFDTSDVTTWRVSAGHTVRAGRDVRWILSDAGIGRHTADARVVRRGTLVGICSVTVVLTPPGDAMASLPSAGVFLVNGTREKEGYGAYSYLLFGAPPSPARRARYRAAVARFLAVAQDIASYDAQLPRARLSVNYLPLDKAMRWGRGASDPAFADSVLAHYQYATAQTLLGWFDGAHLDGPYLVTVPVPLSTTKPVSGKVIFHDLSRVTSDQLVPAWVDEFLAQSKQQQWSDPSAWTRFPLLVRTAIGSVAMGIPQVKSAMKDWSGWLDSWSSIAKPAAIK